jgi:hypothetical protein
MCWNNGLACIQISSNKVLYVRRGGTLKSMGLAWEENSFPPFRLFPLKKTFESLEKSAWNLLACILLPCDWWLVTENVRHRTLTDKQLIYILQLAAFYTSFKICVANFVLYNDNLHPAHHFTSTCDQPVLHEQGDTSNRSTSATTLHNHSALNLTPSLQTTASRN